MFLQVPLLLSQIVHLYFGLHELRLESLVLPHQILIGPLDPRDLAVRLLEVSVLLL